MPTCSLATSGDSRVIYPNEQLQRDIYVVIVPPPLDALDDDPVIVIGIFEYAALKLAAAVWSEAYPGWTGTAEIFSAPLANAAVVGRVMEGQYAGIGAIPNDDRYRLVRSELVPIPDPPPSPWELYVHPRRSGQVAQLAQEFVDSGAPHAKVVVRGVPRASKEKVRVKRADNLVTQLRQAVADLGLPVTAVVRREDVYLSRTDLEEPRAYEGEANDERSTRAGDCYERTGGSD